MASGAAARFGVEPLSIVITRKQPQLFVSSSSGGPGRAAHGPAAKALRFVVSSLRWGIAGPSLVLSRTAGQSPCPGIW
jgi:hypothetical protein